MYTYNQYQNVSPRIFKTISMSNKYWPRRKIALLRKKLSNKKKKGHNNYSIHKDRLINKWTQMIRPKERENKHHKLINTISFCLKYKKIKPDYQIICQYNNLKEYLRRLKDNKQRLLLNVKQKEKLIKLKNHHNLSIHLQTDIPHKKDIGYKT